MARLRSQPRQWAQDPSLFGRQSDIEWHAPSTKHERIEQLAATIQHERSHEIQLAITSELSDFDAFRGDIDDKGSRDAKTRADTPKEVLDITWLANRMVTVSEPVLWNLLYGRTWMSHVHLVDLSSALGYRFSRAWFE